ncbi:hypothetical protein I6A84_14385 [Frankia sp. CNm7]|uniref:Uncharacterized protein n=1 Tax=Frankia nepalensis TaxID=1836974 RepID=A0A937RJJ1_9ACTN|nr:hypothetical protein [Frankia nepalensis]MBL7495646.1 hypothetical protein [Frankia nepalensis]MBL7515757.1 hypothetical protein [Frankia nepalensis]MBL7519260.1 hypothetical protein [Frankia nepalensis]MBL7630115.1 hypothetical protein [Frankia nepalensis]
MAKGAHLNPVVAVAARRYRRRRVAVPIVGQIVLMLPALGCTLAWLPSLIHELVRLGTVAGLATVGGGAGNAFYRDRAA